MKTKEVPRHGWEKLCRQLNETSHGTMVTIQQEQPDGSTSAIVQDAPLQTLAWDDKTDPCNDHIVIEAGLPNQKPLRHDIIEPIHLRLRETQTNRYNRLDILAENGTTTVLFHPGINSAVLQQLEQAA